MHHGLVGVVAPELLFEALRKRERQPVEVGVGVVAAARLGHVWGAEKSQRIRRRFLLRIVQPDGTLIRASGGFPTGLESVFPSGRRHK